MKGNKSRLSNKYLNLDLDTNIQKINSNAYLPNSSNQSVLRSNSAFWISNEKVKISEDQFLGSGKFGKVFLGQFSHAPCAFKKVDNAEKYAEEGELFLSISYHPNVC